MKTSIRRYLPFAVDTKKYLRLLTPVLVAGLTFISWPVFAGPRLVVEPQVVKAGDATSVYGHGFCGDPACSEVLIYLDDRPVSKAVKPSRDGTFSARIQALADPGKHEILAVQSKGPKNGEIRVIGELILGVGARQIKTGQKQTDRIHEIE